MLLRETTADRFRTAPEGRYIRGQGWILFCTSQAAGCVLWGALEGDAIHSLLTLALALHRVASAPRVGVIDAHEIVSVSPTALGHYQEYLRHESVQKSSFRRCAIVRPRLLAPAALSEGLVRILPAPYELSLFADLGECADWLGEPSIASLVQEARALRAEAEGRATARVRRFLLERLRFSSLDDAARILGVSSRSLQRQLKAEGTTFQRELDRERVKAAMRSMRDTNHSLTRIADEVGCASVSHLTMIFHRVVGRPPSRWRREALEDRSRPAAFSKRSSRRL
jgi:AraC-like DNA-binding protein